MGCIPMARGISPKPLIRPKLAIHGRVDVVKEMNKSCPPKENWRIPQ